MSINDIDFPSEIKYQYGVMYHTKNHIMSLFAAIG